MTTDWRPAPGQLALIEPEGSSDICLTGVVMPADDGVVTVDLGASPDALKGGGQVLVSFFAPDALYRVTANARTHEDAQAVIDLDVLEIERVQRRSRPRARAATAAALTAFDSSGEFVVVVGETIDVGLGGCRVRMPQAFRASSTPTLSLRLPDGTTVVTPVETHEERELVSGRFEYRLEFVGLADDDEKRLTTLAG